jgi:tetratricopeptide (TPR) repeat protein
VASSLDHRLGDLAVERGLLTREQLVEALEEQDELQKSGTHTRLGQILVRRHILTVSQLDDLLNVQGVPAPAPVTAVQGKYRIVQDLGSGSSGMVYLAQDVNLERYVALKVLRPDGAFSKTQVSRFMQEGRALAKLNHPGIVRVYEIGQMQDTYFIAMEYVAGHTLERYCLRDRPGPKDAAALMAQVCDAVEHAHGSGIIHRDIKPGNIMVETHPDGRHVARIMDFGLAHDALARTRMTVMGTVLGTPLYMAPEQCTAGQTDVRTDVYALGAVMYELLTGSTPFNGRNTVEIYEAIVNQDPIQPRQLNVRIPPDLELIVLKALNKSPRDRYATAAAMATDLRRFMAGEPVSAKNLSVARRTMLKARRHRGKLAVASVALAALAVAGVLVSRSARQERDFARMLSEVDRFVQSGDFVEGSRRLGEAAVLKPEDARVGPRRDALRALIQGAIAAAESRLQEGRPREATALVGRVLAADPNEARARQVMGRAQATLAAQADALREVTQLLDTARARITECTDSVKLPPGLYDEAKVAETGRQAREALARVLARGEAIDPASRAQAQTFLGRLELLEGDADASAEAYGRAIEVEPSGPAHYGRGNAHVARYRQERAMLAVREKDLPKVYRERLQSMRAAALADFRAAREMKYGMGWESTYVEALVHYFEGQSEEALSKLRPLPPDQAEVWLLRGDALDALGRRAEAVQALETAADIARSDYTIVITLAETHFGNALYGVSPRENVEELDRALKAMDTAVKLRPRLAYVYVQRGRYRHYRIERTSWLQNFDADEEVAKARRDFEQALKIDPKDDRAQSGLGIVMIQGPLNALFRDGGFAKAGELAGQFDEAAKALAKAAELNPWEGYYYKDQGLALAMKGLCLMNSGKDAQPTLDEAFALIQKALQIDEDPTTYEALSLAHLWQASLDMQKMKNPRPHLEKSIAASTEAIKRANKLSLGRALAFRSVVRMTLGLYLFFMGSRAEAADIFDLGADDMRKAAADDPILAMYDPEPIAEFSRALRLQLAEKTAEAREAFASAETKLAKMAEATVGSGAFLARIFGRSMRGFCFFYTERWQQAIDEWQGLTKAFPPITFVLGGWIAQAKKKMKPQ